MLTKAYIFACLMLMATKVAYKLSFKKRYHKGDTLLLTCSLKLD